MLKRVFVSLCAAFLICISAPGQNTRSAVSVTGNDANSCTVPSPCRTFDRAVMVTNSGGEVIALDSGGYGAFTVDRAVTVRPVPGAYAGLAAASFAGVNVAAGPNDNVILRGLTIIGLAGAGNLGIYFNSGASLHVEDCSIDRVTGSGIVNVQAGRLFVSKSTVTNAGGAGILLGNSGDPSVPTVFATISNCSFEHNAGEGVVVYLGASATIARSVLSHNDFGLRVLATVAGINADAVIENSTISGNQIGIGATASQGSTAIARVSNCTISHNATGLSSNNAQNAPILSRQNNTLQANTNNGTFNGTFSAN